MAEDRRIQVGRFKEAEYVVRHFHARTEPGTTREDLLRKEYWSHVSGVLNPDTEISARCDDGSYYAKLLVLDCGSGWAKVQVLQWYVLDDPSVAENQSPASTEDEFDIVWKGDKLKHIVIRKADGQVLHSGEQRKTGAQEWIKDFIAGKARKAEPLENAA